MDTSVQKDSAQPVPLDLSDLGIAFSKLAEALAVEMNWPIKRKYTHAELADSFRAIRQVNEAAERERT